MVFRGQAEEEGLRVAESKRRSRAKALGVVTGVKSRVHGWQEQTAEFRGSPESGEQSAKGRGCKQAQQSPRVTLVGEKVEPKLWTKGVSPPGHRYVGCMVSLGLRLPYRRNNMIADFITEAVFLPSSREPHLPTQVPDSLTSRT